MSESRPILTRFPRNRAILRMLLNTHFPFLIVLWVGFGLLVTAITVVASFFQDVQLSGWDIAGSILRWLALAYGWWWTGQFLPLCLTHGRTRREFTIDVTVFTAIISTVLAVLVTLGYVGEYFLYEAMDWAQDFQKYRLYDSISDYPWIFFTYWVVLLIWSTMGMVLKAGFAQLNEGIGLIALLPVIGLGLLTVAGTGSDSLFSFGMRSDPTSEGYSPLMIGLLAMGYIVGVVLTWALVRCMPIRPAGNT